MESFTKKAVVKENTGTVSAMIRFIGVTPGNPKIEIRKTNNKSPKIIISKGLLGLESQKCFLPLTINISHNST
jgi:hypothetical protein